MPDPATGIVAGTSLLGAGMANSSANKAAKLAAQSEANALAFSKEQYNDWKNIFGPLQQNLASYYNNLTPDRIEAQGKQAIELERDQWLSRIEEDFAARGLSDSALAGSAVTDVERQVATAKADVAATAPEKAAQQKLSFLTLGYGQNPAGMLQNTLNTQAAGARSRANAAAEAAGEAFGSAVSTIGTGLADYYNGGKK